ncbi:MAG: hypothetical protein JXB24_14260, partial [Bacteroidales bacterium]|nr:hypothetical protein [Bacteroidales bacterium]
PMFGTVTEWFYRWLGGIRPVDDEPGFKKFILAPTIPSGLDYVNCSYHSPLGEIISNWKKDGPDGVQYRIKIPEGSTALVDLQPCKVQKVEIIKESKPIKTIVPEGSSSGKFELSEGEFLITVTF